MPVLAQEPTTYPHDLFRNTYSHIERESRSWWVLQTKARQEKAVAREHLRRELPYFLPTTLRRRANQRGEQSSHIPLFTGYVFGYLSDVERFEINRTGRLANFVRVPDQDRIWDELSNLYELLERGYEVHPVLQIKEGSEVTIRSGSLKGISGIVQRTVGRCRFVVRVDFLQFGAAVELDEASLELAICA